METLRVADFTIDARREVYTVYFMINCVVILTKLVLPSYQHYHKSFMIMLIIKKRIAVGRTAGRASDNPPPRLLSSRSGSAIVHVNARFEF